MILGPDLILCVLFELTYSEDQKKVFAAQIPLSGADIVVVSICSVRLQRSHKLKFNRINWLFSQPGEQQCRTFNRAGQPQ